MTQPYWLNWIPLSNMLTKIIYFVFVLSICCNIYCGFDYYKKQQNKRFTESIFNNSKIKDVSLKEGDQFLFAKIKRIHPEYLNKKNYYFISIWNTLCRPCIKEMPTLDSLAENINRLDIAYIFITENGEKMINEFREKHKITSGNFSFINDADIYISSILKSHHLKNRQYPIQLIIDNKGDIKYFQVGTIENANDSLIMNCIKKLTEN